MVVAWPAAKPQSRSTRQRALRVRIYPPQKLGNSVAGSTNFSGGRATRDPFCLYHTPETKLWARLLSGPDKSGIETSGYSRITGSLDNGSAIGEKSQFVRLTPELQDKVVVPDGPVRP